VYIKINVRIAVSHKKCYKYPQHMLQVSAVLAIFRH